MISPGSETDDAVCHSHVVDIAAGDSHTCALLDDQTVSCWGDPTPFGAAGLDEITSPEPVPGLGGVI